MQRRTLATLSVVLFLIVPMNSWGWLRLWDYCRTYKSAALPRSGVAILAEDPDMIMNSFDNSFSCRGTILELLPGQHEVEAAYIHFSGSGTTSGVHMQRTRFIVEGGHTYYMKAALSNNIWNLVVLDITDSIDSNKYKRTKKLIEKGFVEERTTPGKNCQYAATCGS
jgi:hypothetical protein